MKKTQLGASDFFNRCVLWQLPLPCSLTHFCMCQICDTSLWFCNTHTAWQLLWLGQGHMWNDQAKWVWTQTYHIFSFLLGVILHSKSYVLQKTSLKLDMPFYIYDLLKDCQNNRKQKDLFPLFGSISKSQYLRVPTHFAWSHHIHMSIVKPTSESYYLHPTGSEICEVLNEAI